MINSYSKLNKIDYHYSFMTTSIFFVSIIACVIVTLIVKKLVSRDRPEMKNENRLINLRHLEGNKALPSGDTAQSALFAGTMLFYF